MLLKLEEKKFSSFLTQNLKMNSNKLKERHLLEDNAFLALANEQYNKFWVLLDAGVNPNRFKSVFIELLIVRHKYNSLTTLFNKYQAKIPNFKIIKRLILTNNITVLKIFVQHGLLITTNHINFAKKFNEKMIDFLESIYDAQLKCDDTELQQVINFL